MSQAIRILKTSLTNFQAQALATSNKIKEAKRVIADEEKTLIVYMNQIAELTEAIMKLEKKEDVVKPTSKNKKVK